jgi:hypothetical protein
MREQWLVRILAGGPGRPDVPPDHGCEGGTVSPSPQSNSQTSAGIQARCCCTFGPPLSVRSRCNWSDACFVIAALHQNSQSNPRQLVSECDGQDVTMQALSRCREPGSKAVVRPARRMKLYGTSALDEEHPQIATTMLSDAAKYGAITSRHLPRYQAQPGGKVPPFCKGSSTDRSKHRACDDGA